MTTMGHPHLSNYARMAMDRGADVLAGQIARLEEMATLAMTRLDPVAAARVPLEMAMKERARPGPDEAARRLDVLSDAIVRAQRLVDHDSRASAVLFLSRSERDRWKSYADYRRSWNDYAAKCISDRRDETTPARRTGGKTR